MHCNLHIFYYDLHLKTYIPDEVVFIQKVYILMHTYTNILGIFYCLLH